MPVEILPSKFVSCRISGRAALILSHYQRTLGDGDKNASEARVMELGLAMLELAQVDLKIHKAQTTMYHAILREAASVNLQKLDRHMQQFKLKRGRQKRNVAPPNP